MAFTSFKDVLFLVVQLRRNDDRDRLPNGFLFRISKQPLGRPVPRQDHAVEVLRNDGIVRGIDNRGEPQADVFLLSLNAVDSMTSVPVVHSLLDVRMISNVFVRGFCPSRERTLPLEAR